MPIYTLPFYVFYTLVSMEGSTVRDITEYLVLVTQEYDNLVEVNSLFFNLANMLFAVRRLLSAMYATIPSRSETAEFVQTT